MKAFGVKNGILVLHSSRCPTDRNVQLCATAAVQFSMSCPRLQLSDLERLLWPCVEWKSERVACWMYSVAIPCRTDNKLIYYDHIKLYLGCKIVPIVPIFSWNHFLWNMHVVILWRERKRMANERFIESNGACWVGSQANASGAMPLVRELPKDSTSTALPAHTSYLSPAPPIFLPCVVFFTLNVKRVHNFYTQCVLFPNIVFYFYTPPCILYTENV